MARLLRFLYFRSMDSKICTAAAPFEPGNPEHSKFRWAHPDAIEIEEDYGKGGGVADGDFVKYKCPHCEHSFWIELPN